MTEVNCPICSREHGEDMQWHHLKPLTFSSRDKSLHHKDNQVLIHKMCHQKIHATFSEKELFDYYHTPERILENENMQKFVRWISKRPPDFYNKNDDTNQRKKKRKRR